MFNINQQIKKFGQIGLNLDEESKQKALKTAGAAALVAASGGLNVAADAALLIAQIDLMFSLFKNKPNPNDWMGWDALDIKIGAPIGTNALQWVILDGDSVQNEALNIVSYIKANGTKNLLGFSKWFNRTITINDIADKLARGGFLEEANYIKLQNLPAVTNVTTPVQTITPISNTPTQTKINIWVTLGLFGAGLFLISKMKK
jgi:hypothetical protein